MGPEAHMIQAAMEKHIPSAPILIILFDYILMAQGGALQQVLSERKKTQIIDHENKHL